MSQLSASELSDFFAYTSKVIHKFISQVEGQPVQSGVAHRAVVHAPYQLRSLVRQI